MEHTAKTITQSQRMTVIGLLTLGADLQMHLDLVLRALINTTGEESALGSHCEDALFGYLTRDRVNDADQLLQRLHITVVPDEPTDGKVHDNTPTHASQV